MPISSDGAGDREVDPRSGRDVERSAVALGSVETDLVEGGSSYILHIWSGGRCVVVERRGDEWGFTPDLESDGPAFNSGHTFVYRDGAQMLTALGRALGGLPEA